MAVRQYEVVVTPRKSHIIWATSATNARRRVWEYLRRGNPYGIKHLSQLKAKLLRGQIG